ncbi:MAG: hypothetical protein Q9160_000358 [Pyrenula sp. 1 TL-2023]
MQRLARSKVEVSGEVNEYAGGTPLLFTLSLTNVNNNAAAQSAPQPATVAIPRQVADVTSLLKTRSSAGSDSVMENVADSSVKVLDEIDAYAGGAPLLLTLMLANVNNNAAAQKAPQAATVAVPRHVSKINYVSAERPYECISDPFATLIETVSMLSTGTLDNTTINTQHRALTDVSKGFDDKQRRIKRLTSTEQQLTGSQLNSFKEQGYIVIPDVLHPEGIEALRCEAGSAIHKASTGGDGCQSLDLSEKNETPSPVG